MSSGSTLYVRFELGGVGRTEKRLLFNRWFPMGQADAIDLKTDDKNASVRVWAERSECIRGDWEAAVGEGEDELISRIGVIESGPLHGELTIARCKEEDFPSIGDGSKEPRYEKLGRRVVKILDKAVCPFVRLLRIRFGHYWFPELHPWDGRENSLGAHCSQYLMRWSRDQKTWKAFVPAKVIFEMEMVFDRGGKTYKECLSEEDWKSLAALASDYSPSLADDLIGKAHEAADRKELEVAFVFAVSALELTLSEFFNNVLLRKTDHLDTQNKLLAAASLCEGIDKATLKDAIGAIAIRNNIVHPKAGRVPWNSKRASEAKEQGDSRKRGRTESHGARKHLYALLRLTSQILEGRSFKFPARNHGNTLFGTGDDGA